MSAPDAPRPLPGAPVALAAGDELAPVRLGPLSRTDFVRYAGAGGDFNPLHHDEELARAAGLPSVFGMGMLHAGALAAHVARWVGPGSLRTFAARFSGRVLPGDELVLSGRVTEVAGDVARIELRIVRQTGEEVLRASAEATVRANR